MLITPQIINDNIRPGLEGQFAKARNSDNQQEEYDFCSIMHYRQTAFSRVCRILIDGKIF